MNQVQQKRNLIELKDCNQDPDNDHIPNMEGIQKFSALKHFYQ